MSEDDQIRIDQDRLVEAWNRTLPTLIRDADTIQVKADKANRKAVRIRIASADHSQCTFDFKCAYQDCREVAVELVDVEQGHEAVDEHSRLIQELIQDYVRSIHECAQVLQELTHPLRAEAFQP